MENVFLRIISMSTIGSYVILFAVVIRWMLKKSPKIFSYVLWSVVFFRLLSPFSFESTLSLIRFNTKPVHKIITHGQVSPINNGTAAIEGVVAQGISTPVEVMGGMDSSQSWTTAGGVIWLIGISVLLIYCFYTTIRLHNSVKTSARIYENEYENVYQLDVMMTPFVLGLFRPRIYIPKNLTQREISYIVKHEQNHIRRFDHIIKPVSFLAVCIHWFNPLVWVAFFLMVEDMELSCDESVIRQLGSDIKKDYTASLLTLSAGRKIISRCPLAFGESNTKARIINILRYKKPAFWIVAVSIIAVAAVVVGLVSNHPGEKMTEKDYAEQFVQNQIAVYDDATWADFTNVDSEITKFERLDRFDGLLDSPVEIWHIEYRFKADDIDEGALGNVNYVDGWIVEDDTSGFKALVFSYEKAEPKYLGSIYSIDGLNGNGDTIAGREALLRVYLEQHGLIPNETYKSDHIIVRFPLSTGETCQLLLSQPIKKGGKGIWCVERWMDGNGMVYYDIPITDGRAVEYYDELQKECDEGSKPNLLDPIQVALEHINGEGALGQRVSSDELEILYDVTAEDFLKTPESHYIGFISNFNTEEYENPYFHLDQIEWLTIEDTARLKELNIDPDDLPNGYYIYNPTSYPMYHQCDNATKYSIIDFTVGDYGVSHKSVSATDFVKYLSQFDDFIPPFHVYTKDGFVKEVLEQYVP